MALILSRIAGQGRSLHAAALELFMFGYPVPEPTLREAMCWTINRIDRRADRIREAGLGAVERSMARAMRQITVDHPILLAYNVGAGLPIAERRKRRRELKEATRTLVDLALYDDVPAADSVADILRTSGMPETARIVGASLQAEEFTGATGWQGKGRDLLRHQLKTVSIDRLHAARFVGVLWLCTYTLLSQAALVGDETAVLVLQALESEDYMKYVKDQMSFFSGPEAITCGLLNYAHSELAFDMTWFLCRMTYPLADAVYLRTIGAADDSQVDDAAVAVLPEEVPEVPPLTTEGLWRLAHTLRTTQGAGAHSTSPPVPTTRS
jgi:hypothetical protein